MYVYLAHIYIKLSALTNNNLLSLALGVDQLNTWILTLEPEKIQNTNPDDLKIFKHMDTNTVRLHLQQYFLIKKMWAAVKLLIKVKKKKSNLI